MIKKQARRQYAPGLSCTALLIALSACAAEMSLEPNGGKADDPDSQSGLCLLEKFATDNDRLEDLNGGLDPFNASFEDFASEIRDQGTIASCASHTILAVLENQLFNDRGISVDLSERYTLYSNYMATKDMGTSPNVIRQFPSIIEQYGLMPESIWPYEEVLSNAHRFSQDAAQNLGETESQEPTIDEAVANTECTEERSEILQQDIYLGALPADSQPVHLPVLAAHIEDDARMTEFADLDTGEVSDCFTDDANLAGTGPSVSPRDFLRLCFDFRAADYFSCTPDNRIERTLELLAGDSPDPVGTLCGEREATRDILAQEIHDFKKSLLSTLLHLSEQGQTSFVGVSSPAAGGTLPLWYTKLPAGAGHAVTAVGHLTAAELADVAEQEVGLLGKGIFDELATALDEALPPGTPGQPFQGVEADDSPEEKMAKRLASRLATKVLAEGGLIFFRNSWGIENSGVRIGLRGYQGMTFEYFVRNAVLVLSRKHQTMKNLFVVDGVSMDGPLYCPADHFPISSGDPWIQENHAADMPEVADVVMNSVCGAP